MTGIEWPWAPLEVPRSEMRARGFTQQVIEECEAELAKSGLIEYKKDDNGVMWFRPGPKTRKKLA